MSEETKKEENLVVIEKKFDIQGWLAFGVVTFIIIMLVILLFRGAIALYQDFFPAAPTPVKEVAAAVVEPKKETPPAQVDECTKAGVKPGQLWVSKSSKNPFEGDENKSFDKVVEIKGGYVRVLRSALSFRDHNVSLDCDFFLTVNEKKSDTWKDSDIVLPMDSKENKLSEEQQDEIDCSPLKVGQVWSATITDDYPFAEPTLHKWKILGVKKGYVKRTCKHEARGWCIDPCSAFLEIGKLRQSKGDFKKISD